MFIRDGINNALALTQADIGVVENRTDMAIKNSNVIIVEEYLENVVVAVQFFKKVMKRIKENIFLAFAYNIILIPIAAGTLYTSFGLMFMPELASFTMTLSSVSVISLSLALKRYVSPVKIGH